MMVTTGARGVRSAGSSTNWLGALLLLLGVLDLHLALELLGQDEDGVVGQRLGDGDHLAQLDQGLDEFARARSPGPRPGP